MIRRNIEDIKKKGFAMSVPRDDYETPPMDFSKLRVGVKTIEDAILNIGDLKRTNGEFNDKSTILEAISSKNIDTMRKISDYFYRTSGIYARLVRYLAYLYRYDWLITPYGKLDKKQSERIISDFNKVLNYFDNLSIKKTFGEIALKVIKNGCYYGYVIQDKDFPAIQELPPEYCRSRFRVNGRPAIEFNMKFFDDYFTDKSQRERMLKLFPKDFLKGYNLYKAGKLKGDFVGDDRGWYLLEVGAAFKFNINDEDYPMLIAVVPTLLDLDEAKALDRKKTQQKLLKLVIQKMPFDKDGDLIFDIDEARQLHNNAVQMLGRAIGIDVLTTFADVDVESMSDSNISANNDELTRIERAVYNEAGISQMQFNTDGNIALEKSILNDEATIYNLIAQFEEFLNDLLKVFNKRKNIHYRAQMLTTTIYNYKDMSKLYKEQTQLGYSKMLPQIALGQSQSSILANAYFENDILELFNVFIPPLMSSTMNAESLNKTLGNGEEKQAGRKEKADDEKSEKTIANKESMS